MKKKPSIWANCVVKNEERWIWYALKSVLDHIDKVLVWDTGSSDKTEKIIKTINNNKISFKQIGSVDKNNFANIRQQMINKTFSDWILNLDGDEIWPKKSIIKLKNAIIKAPKNINTFCVRPINFVGDIRFIHPEVFLGQTPYGPKGLKGFFSNRVFRCNTPGLYVAGDYGKEGFYDNSNKTLIENKNQTKFLQDVYYWHMSYLPRSLSEKKDKQVMMRKRKRKHELGVSKPNWIEIPEVFYLPRPSIVPDPFYKMNNFEYLKAVIQTPLKKFKRKVTGWKR